MFHFLYKFQLAIQNSHKHQWWSFFVQPLRFWWKELREFWICCCFTLQKFILESAFDKLRNVCKLETKYKHSFLYTKTAKVMSKKFYLGCCFKNVQKKFFVNSFQIGCPSPLIKHRGCLFQQWPRMRTLLA